MTTAITTTKADNTASSSKQQQQQQQHEQSSSRRVRNSLIAGSISGMAATVGLYPMDFVRTRLQAAGQSTTTSRASSPWQVVRDTVRHGGGLSALYTGVTMPLLAQAVYKGCIFSLNQAMETYLLERRRKQHPASSTPELTVSDRFWCGFAAGAINGGLFVTPVEFVRNQQIADEAKRAAATAPRGNAGGGGAATSLPPRTAWQVIRSTLQSSRPWTLWRGVGITMVRDGAGVGVFFPVMAVTQQWLLVQLQRQQQHSDTSSTTVPLWISFVSGGCAGLAYWVVGLPLDTVKTWIQSADVSTTTTTSTGNSLTAQLRTMHRQWGTRGLLDRLFRGWQVAYARGIPSAAITVSVYTSILQVLSTSAL